MMKRLLFFLAFVSVLLMACDNNDSFSNDRSHRLTFAVDTVRFDTLFTTVPSSTRSFWIYNFSGDGLRVSSIRLERGNQSGFRVNVDGTFVNPVATDIEVRKGDSIRVFVEITAYENRSKDPKLVEDNLLFTLESGAEQKVNLRTVSWDATKLTNLEVEEDMEIASDVPVVVYGAGIRVAENATLTIRNTTLYFHDGAGLQVEGKLIAENCLFRGDRLDHMFDYLTYDRVSGQWSGIVVKPRAAGCSLTNCTVRSAYHGLVADSTVVSLEASVIHNSKGYGLIAHDSELTLRNSLFSNALNDCMALYGCTAEVDACTLAQFYAFSANRGAALRFAPSDNYPLALHFTNTLVTGLDDDVLMGVPRNEENVSYLFENCLLRTPAVDDAEAFVEILWETIFDAVQGAAHFQNVDPVNFIYDFRLKDTSPCVERTIGWKAAEIGKDDGADNSDNSDNNE